VFLPRVIQSIKGQNTTKGRLDDRFVLRLYCYQMAMINEDQSRSPFELYKIDDKLSKNPLILTKIHILFLFS